jgi:glycosyltransferase involved in cell wall biosynthesis
MKRFLSIRTATDRLTETLQKEYPHIADISTLPRFHNFAGIAQNALGLDIKQKYTQFSFIILYVGQLSHGCRAFQAIDSSRNLMRSPKVGLVVLGDGEARTELQSRAKVLGIESQVVFEKNTNDMYSYLKSADVLIIPDANEFSDELAIKGAASGIPLVLAHTQQRQDLFTDGESALFFEDNNIISMSDQMKKILNDLGVRTALSHNARVQIAEKLHEDPLVYKLAYRDCVEEALFPEDSKGTV